MSLSPRTIRIHPNDNVAVVVNDGGLPAGTTLPDGPTLVQHLPQGHKVALCDLPAGSEVRRYNAVIGHTAESLPAGSWVSEQRLVPAA
jgi:galactarate dehydratase